MAQKLRINNFNDLNIVETGQLNADVAAAATTFTTVNNQDFAVDDNLYVGRFGSEVGETLIVASKTGNNSVTVDSPGAKFAHNRLDSIASLFGDKIRVYRAANSDGTVPADGSFSLLATVSIDYDQLTTDYTDPNGSSSYWYKYTYYNSVTTSETSLTDSRSVRGGGVGNYASIESIRGEAGLRSNRWITDADIDLKRQAAQSEINAALVGLYTVPFTAPINPLIAEITRKIAAGMLLTDNYGPTSALTTNNGLAKLKEGRDLLEKLNTKKIVLTNILGSDESAVPGGAPSFWPDPTTATAEPENGGGKRMFRVSDRY